MTVHRPSLKSSAVGTQFADRSASIGMQKAGQKVGGVSAMTRPICAVLLGLIVASPRPHADRRHRQRITRRRCRCSRLPCSRDASRRRSSISASRCRQTRAPGARRGARRHRRAGRRRRPRPRFSIATRWCTSHINPESRVKVTAGAAAPLLVQAGTRVFLVKVVNEAGITARAARDQPAEPAACRCQLGRQADAGAGADDHRAGHPRAVGRHHAVRQAADDRAAVGAAARVPRHRDLQSRRGPAAPPTCRSTSARARRTSAFAATSPWCSPPRRRGTSPLRDRGREGASPAMARLVVRDARRASLPGALASAWRRTCRFSRRCTAATASRWRCRTASSR